MLYFVATILTSHIDAEMTSPLQQSRTSGTGVRAMRVLMTSTSYPASLADWRGLFIRHLADALARREDLLLDLWAPPGDVDSRVMRVTTAAEDRWFAALMRDGGIAHLLRTRKLLALARSLQLIRSLHRVFARTTVDAYHINWLQNALPLPNNRLPALITVLGTDVQLLRLPLMRALIRRVLRRRKVAICPNAEWMVPPLEAAFGDLARVRAVPFGIDPCWYAMQRQMRDSPAHWLVVSRLTRDKLGYLFEWCRPLFADGVRKLHLFGPMQESIEVPHWIEYHGPVTPNDLCNEWFPRTHGLITLSRHSEGRPQVMLEGMAAGLPIVALRTSAHESMLRHRATGWLVASPDELRNALDALDNRDENIRIGNAARAQIAAEVGTWDDCAQRYATIYAGLIEASPA